MTAAIRSSPIAVPSAVMLFGAQQPERYRAVDLAGKRCTSSSPGSRPAAGATPVVLTNAAPVLAGYSTIQWSPAGDWIAYPSAEGISMISPDGDTVRNLTARKLRNFAFSKDGKQVYGIFRNTAGEGPQWQLYSIDAKTGADKMLAPIDLPASADDIAGFSLHPDGKRFLTSIAKLPFDIWMLEGWGEARQKTWFDRLLRR